MLEKAAKAAHVLESTAAPIGRMQRAFYFQILGDEEAALEEWREAFRRGLTGVFASYYATDMFGRGRSAEALETLNRMEPRASGTAGIGPAVAGLD